MGPKKSHFPEIDKGVQNRKCNVLPRVKKIITKYQIRNLKKNWGRKILTRVTEQTFLENLQKFWFPVPKLTKGDKFA
jgi:hypothetical protein